MAKKDTSKRNRRLFIAAMVLWFIGILVWYLHAKNFQVLNPAGMVAVKQRNLLIMTVLLSLIVIVPVYTMLVVFSLKYRASNPKKAKYSPEMAGNRAFEALWWGIPTAIILFLSIVTWNTSHSMDPHRKLDVAGNPMTIQVVALDWKWLFIYPEQDVASVNYLKMPVGTPVTFEITSDAPMNSFWIPQLGGQIYAMTGMSTHLNLIADKAGEYPGSSANLSGAGFSDMRFVASAVPMNDFEKWVDSAPAMGRAPLTEQSYQELRKPSVVKEGYQYSSVDPDLYATVIRKYMGPN